MDVGKHTQGDFCWIELATTDQSAAKKFYSELFRWSIGESEMAPDDFYTTFKIDGRAVAAAYTLRSEQRARGVPAHWSLYVAVENTDTTTSRATGLGAKVIAEPLDVYNVGRMAVLQDPTGAVFSVLQAKTHSGFGIRGIPATFCAADLSTPDQTGASRFYEQLFGWRIEKEDETSGHNYYHLFNHGEFIGGILPPAFRDPGTPSHWQVYLAVSDCNEAATRAKNLGARLHMPPMNIEKIGRMAVMTDPQGAAFAIFEATPQ
jgi:predicted enzyme related to lactoylglutathione lyase